MLMNRKYYKITGHDNLRRDAESMGIVNVDRESLNKHREEREFKRKLSQMVTEHIELKNELGNIKAMLAQLLGKMGT